MRIIIVGAGKVGYAVASLLAREKHDITVIDRDPETLSYVSNALDVVKEAATKVIGSNDEDAVAEFLSEIAEKQLM